MADLWRWIMTRFGARYVVLTDFDDEVVVRRVHWKGGKPHANRLFGGFEPIAVCRLKDGGAISGPSWVTSWEPYVPFQRRMPEAQQ